MTALPRARAIASLLFGFSAPVTRSTYLTAGVALWCLKYVVDAALGWCFASGVIDPLTYLNPLLTARLDPLGDYPAWLPVVMLSWALPFIWVGVSMTARRAVNAGASALWSGLFFVPVLNYLLIAALCAAPEVSARSAGDGELTRGMRRGSDTATLLGLRAAALSVFVAAVFAAFAVVFEVFGVEQYGTALFIGAPFVLGVIAGVLYNRDVRRSASGTLAVAVAAVTLAGGALLLLSLEGALCLVMAAIPACPLAILGALLGRALTASRRPEQPALGVVAAWPLLALLPGDEVDRFPIRTTVSSVEVAAPPERVWPNVVAFPPLPPPSEWLMQTGVACPQSARIEGEGVSSVRYCEFTTGVFVEPITVWDPPRRLAFDVAEQPPSMREWSPYEVVHAPHLHGGVQSLRGQFELTRLPGDRTLLTGTTWYQVKMAPNAYWSLYAGYAIHVIHERVLSHIRRLSEASPHRDAVRWRPEDD